MSWNETGGIKGAETWLKWMFTHIEEIKFEPVTIMIDGNTFFEEFIVNARLHNNINVRSKQAEVLIFDNYKVKSLRLYFDRMDFADSFTKGKIGKMIVKNIIKRSLAGLS